MTQFFLTDANPANDNIDLAGAPAITVTNLSATAVQINIEYRPKDNWINAMNNGGPFPLQPDQTRVVVKGNLLSEHLRVAVTGNAFRVSVRY